MLGAHLAVDNAILRAGVECGLSVAQVFVTSPRSYILPKIASQYDVYKQFYHKAPFIIHSPYLVSYYKDIHHRQPQFTLQYLLKLAEEADKYNIPVYYVTHLGKVPKDVGEDELLHNFSNMLYYTHDIIKDSKLRLFIENDAGSKDVPQYNTAHYILKIKHILKQLNIGICFDTEHAYASGLKRKYWKQMSKISEIIHFNAVPKEVVFGKHLDRHSATSMAESKINVIEWLQLPKQSSKIFIAERSSLRIVKQDFLHLVLKG